MSELGKGLYKVTPADLSTQDFIPDGLEKGRGVSSPGAALLRIDLQQYDCSQLDRWTVAHRGFASTATPDATLPPSSTLPTRYFPHHQARHAAQRSNSERDLRKKDCWIHLPQGQNSIISLILLSFNPNPQTTIAPSARNTSKTTSRFILIHSAHHSPHPSQKNRSLRLRSRHILALQIGQEKSHQIRGIERGCRDDGKETSQVRN